MDPTDRALIDGTLAGDLSSFDALMRRHERPVYRVCLLFGRTKENALDLSQEVFMKAYRHLGAFRGGSAFRTWILRIAYNEGLSWARARHRRGDTGGSDALDTLSAAPATAASQERALLDRERALILTRKIGELNPRQRMAITLRYFRQMPLREIADVLQCSEGNVKNMLFRSVRKLRDSLAGSGLEEWT